MRYTSPVGQPAATAITPAADQLASTQLDAVIIRDLTYVAGRGKGRKTILNRINLTVPEGSIYGLLGPSGCGKTTMLRCMVGRIKPGSGTVMVFGLEPGSGEGEVPGRDVGYMPQEISVYEDFTIEETLKFFGKINRMQSRAIDKRIEFLLQFLDLPSRDRVVGTLSGGQKRRVSLAAALVHSPPLLILDEPTVGVDPLLRQSIWRHLVSMTKNERISVIITTHYIEEARLANVVGLMRNGRILAENSPDELMHQNGLSNLEEVFLKLCVTDSSRQLVSSSAASPGGASGGQHRARPPTAPTAAAAAAATTTTPTTIVSTTGASGASKSSKYLPDEREEAERPSRFRKRKSTVVGVNADVSPVEAVRELEAKNIGWPGESSKGTALDASRATVRINTGTNKIELLNAGYVNESVEDFSSEDEKPLDRGRLNLSPIVTTREPTVTSESNQEAVESYLSKQHIQWAARRSELANLMRLNNGRRFNKGPYLGLDGRRTHKSAIDSYSASHFEEAYGFRQWWETLMAVTWKNFARLRRNPPVLVFQFVLPAIQVILFCLCIGGEPFDVPVAIVNEETNPRSSLEFLDRLNKRVVRQVNYNNLTSAIDDVRRGKVWGALHIPSTYSENLIGRLTMGEKVTNETINNSTIRLYPDLTNLHLSLTLETTFREAFIKFSRGALAEAGYHESLAELPIRIERPIYGSLRKDSYLEFMAPGVIISITYVMATGLTALAFILERRDGLLERSLVSGVQTSQILLAHAINQVCVMIIQIFLVLGCSFYIFGISSHGSFLWVILLILLQGCTGMGFGLLVSAVCKEENTAVMMVVGTFYTNLILAGIIWPLEAMPHWIRPISWIQPQTLPTETLRHILSRGWGITEPAVCLGFAVTIGWLLVFLMAAGLVFKYSR